jgi:uncharacterized protein (TIGR02678 family)
MTSDDLRAAARTLLTNGFVSGPDAVVVRRHRRELSSMFLDRFGWHLLADDFGPVRLLVQPGPGHIPRGVVTRGTRSAFDPRRYTLVFLILASLETAGARTTLSVLFNDVDNRASLIDVEFDSTVAAHRRAFVHAVQTVADHGILELADGSEEAFVAGTGDALYRVQRNHLTRLLATSKPPSLVGDAEAAIDDEALYSPTREGQNRRRLHRIMRTLVCEPVLYRSDLDDDELEYMRSQESNIRRRLTDDFGLELETRAEGWVTVDTAAVMTDAVFPPISKAGAAAVAILDDSRTRRRTPGPSPVPAAAETASDTHSPAPGRRRVEPGTVVWDVNELRTVVSELGSRLDESWNVAADDVDAIETILDAAVGLLVSFRLAHRDGDVVVVDAASGRFSASPRPDQQALSVISLELP